MSKRKSEGFRRKLAWVKACLNEGLRIKIMMLPERGWRGTMRVGGENACPLENSGGIFGYYEKLEILKDRALSRKPSR